MDLIEVKIEDLAKGTPCYIKKPYHEKQPDEFKVGSDFQSVIDIATGKESPISEFRTNPTVYVDSNDFSIDQLKKLLASCFIWGPVLDIHTIGEYQIVEYNPPVFKNCQATGEYKLEETNYSVYKNWTSLNVSEPTLDGALIIAIAQKHDGLNSKAGFYFKKMIGIEE